MNGKLATFEPAILELSNNRDEFIRRYGKDLPPDEVDKAYDKLMRDEVWINDEYQVNIDKKTNHGLAGFTIWHLSIKRLDKEPIHDWRDLQQIKNMLVGKEYEAVELYPAKSRVHDSANQYHLWAFIKYEEGMTTREAPTIPVGWTNRFVGDTTLYGSKQRPFNKD
jgi:hypothetical protein